MIWRSKLEYRLKRLFAGTVSPLTRVGKRTIGFLPCGIGRKRPKRIAPIGLPGLGIVLPSEHVTHFQALSMQCSPVGYARPGCGTRAAARFERNTRQNTLNSLNLSANHPKTSSGDGPPPSLQPHYRAFIATTRQSAPLRRIGTFGLAIFRRLRLFPWHRRQGSHVPYRAWLGFAPPTRRMPFGQYQDIPQTDPGGRVSPRF